MVEATGEAASVAPSGEGSPPTGKKELTAEEKRERAKSRLIEGVQAGDFSNLLNRVAAILNLYPAARNSDVILSLNYWEEFHRDLYNPNGIKPADFFVLERVPNLVRARAKIQNEFGLFVASEEIRKRRRSNEDSLKAEIIESTPPPLQVVQVFADETGKNDIHLMVSAVWVLSGRAVFSVSRAIQHWKSHSGGFSNRELHFTRLKKDDGKDLASYLDVIKNNIDFLSFKVIGVERARIKRPIHEAVLKLHEHMLKTGCDHEIKSGRITLPRTINVTLDKDTSIDGIALADLRHSAEQFMAARFGAGVSIGEVAAASSDHSALLQLADIVAGAVNRRRNHSGDRGYKDDFADMIIDRLQLSIEHCDNEDFDSSAMLKL